MMTLTRNGRKILDHNLACLIQQEPIMPTVLEELVLDIHEYPDLVSQQILCHRFFKELVYGLLSIMDRHTPERPRLSGNAAYVFGALIDCEEGRDKILPLLQDPDRCEETERLIPILGQLIEIFDLESMTNASGTVSLLVQNEEYREWALDQPSIDWLIHILGKTLLESDMWVSSNCALTLARICMSPAGREKMVEHKDAEHIIIRLIMSLGIDNEGRGMNAAFALAYLCEDHETMKQIAYMKEVLDLNFGLINMLKSVNDDCRKNAVFCFKKMSQWPEGCERINDDPDIDHLLKLLSNLLTCGVEDLGKMAAVTLKNMAVSRVGYMLQKDHSSVKSICRHVLSQMNISPAYRQDAFECLKAVLIPKPEPPALRVIDAFTIDITWKPVEAKSGFQVWYELYNGDNVIYTGSGLCFTEEGLKERTNYEYYVRAYTDDDEESFPSEISITQTHKATSSPPVNVRAIRVTSRTTTIKWEKPEKLMGTLKGYFIQEVGTNIHYEPVSPYHIASNLNPDTEYTFEVCAVTNKGRGLMANVTVRTSLQDANAPSRPTVLVCSPHEMVVTWRPPSKPVGKISGYEVLCNGKSIFFGQQKRCIASQLDPNRRYKFVVVAWTSEGKTESEPAMKKTCGLNHSMTAETPKFRNKDELFKWLDSQEAADLELAAEEDNELMNDYDDSSFSDSAREPSSPGKPALQIKGPQKEDSTVEKELEPTPPKKDPPAKKHITPHKPKKPPTRRQDSDIAKKRLMRSKLEKEKKEKVKDRGTGKDEKKEKSKSKGESVEDGTEQNDNDNRDDINNDYGGKGIDANTAEVDDQGNNVDENNDNNEEANEEE